MSGALQSGQRKKSERAHAKFGNSTADQLAEMWNSGYKRKLRCGSPRTSKPKSGVHRAAVRWRCFGRCLTDQPFKESAQRRGLERAGAKEQRGARLPSVRPQAITPPRVPAGQFCTLADFAIRL